MLITADNIVFVIYSVGIRILFIRITKLKNNEILFFMLSPALHQLEFLCNFIIAK